MSDELSRVLDEVGHWIETATPGLTDLLRSAPEEVVDFLLPTLAQTLGHSRGYVILRTRSLVSRFRSAFAGRVTQEVQTRWLFL